MQNEKGFNVKVQIVTQSGKPVNVEDAIKFDEEFRLLYDKSQDKAEALKKKPRFKNREVMKLMERYLSFSEHLLNVKYNSNSFVEMPKTAKAWRTLIDKHANIPILVAKRADKKGTVLVVMDSGL